MRIAIHGSSRKMFAPVLTGVAEDETGRLPLRGSGPLAAFLDAWRERRGARGGAMLVASGRLTDYLRTAGV